MASLFRFMLLFPLLSATRALAQAPAPACRATAEGVPSALLGRAVRAVSMTPAGRVLKWSAHGSAVQDFQSDRSYPPFFSFYYTQTAFFDPRTGAERSTRTGGGYPGTDIPASRAGIL